jgi:hypothetical protein
MYFSSTIDLCLLTFPPSQRNLASWSLSAEQVVKFSPVML